MVSVAHSGQTETRVIEGPGETFQRHVSPGECLFVVLFKKQCADEAHDSGVIGEDA